jgi:hypothetical protein
MNHVGNQVPPLLLEVINSKMYVFGWQSPLLVDFAFEHSHTGRRLVSLRRERG